MSFKPGIKRSQDTRSERIQRQQRAARKRRQMSRLRATPQIVSTVESKTISTFKAPTALTAPTDSSGAEVDPASTALCLNSVNQGDSFTDRDGRKIMLKSVHVVGTVSCAAQADQTALDEASNVYIALVLDTQTNGAQLNSEDVFSNPSGSATLAASPIRNMNRIDRYKVLKSERLVFDRPPIQWDGTNIEQGGLVQNFEIYKKLSLPVSFSGNGNGIADIVDNSLHVIAYCSNTGLVPTIQYNSRVVFSG